MCVCVCVYVRTHVYKHTYIHANIQTNIHTYIHTHVRRTIHYQKLILQGRHAGAHMVTLPPPRNSYKHRYHNTCVHRPTILQASTKIVAEQPNTLHYVIFSVNVDYINLPLPSLVSCSIGVTRSLLPAWRLKARLWLASIAELYTHTFYCRYYRLKYEYTYRQNNTSVLCKCELSSLWKRDTAWCLRKASHIAGGLKSDSRPYPFLQREKRIYHQLLPYRTFR